jgi:BirA family transcriptional regulator, biotin operon repressor / biotin---[acetyl-CoA-carboxylase] ligase
LEMSAPSSSRPAYDVRAIQAGLRTAAIGRTIHYQDTIASTNATAIVLAQDGACHGTLVLADAQTAGRGRRGRHWHSPPARNLYCSVILRSDQNQAGCLTIIPLASALAVADAIADVASIQCRLKWPNDVMIGEKKVAGILCESVGGQPASIVVVGLGINANSRREDFPTETQATAATLLAERGTPVDRTVLVSTLMNRLEGRMNLLSSQAVLDSYRARCATLGQLVRATLGDGDMIEGIAETIGGDGSLLIRRNEPGTSGSAAELVEIRSADIVHLRQVTHAGSMR